MEITFTCQVMLMSAVLYSFKNINDLIYPQVPQSIVIVPGPLVKNHHKDDVMRLVKVYWTEHLIEEKLLQPTSTPILLRYYSERLMEERYNRAKMEVKLYGDAIARDGLPLIESGEFSHYDLCISYIYYIIV
jgi:hypothetical protein